MSDRQLPAVLDNGAEAMRRDPPSAIEVEQALLGALLRKNALVDLAADTGLAPVHFYAPEHQRLYALIEGMVERGKPATPASLSQAVSQDEALSELGVAYLRELEAGIITLSNVEDYARQVTDTYRRRELIGALREATDELYTFDLDRTAQQIGETLTDTIMGVSPDAPDESKVVTLGQAVRQAIDQFDEAQRNPDSAMGLMTGFGDLDEMLTGFAPEQLVVLAGRPAMGKTAFSFALLQRLAAHALGQGHTLFFSLEMGATELAERAIAAKARISTRKARRGRIDNPADWEKIEDAGQSYQTARVLIDDRPGHTVASIERSLRQQMRRRKVVAVVIDYLQIIKPPRDSAHRSRNDEISVMTRALKTLAKRWKIPVILLSQLSRDVEKREDKRPMLSDLRDSGSIEQDADVVGFLYRPEYYLEREEPERRAKETHEQFIERKAVHETRVAEARNVLEIIIAKQRRGPIGTVELYCDLSTMTFASLSREQQGDADQGICSDERPIEVFHRPDRARPADVGARDQRRRYCQGLWFPVAERASQRCFSQRLPAAPQCNPERPAEWLGGSCAGSARACHAHLPVSAR